MTKLIYFNMSDTELTIEQQEIILKEWNSRPDNPPSLLELINLTYPNQPEIDGRSKEGKSIKAFLATREIKAKGAHEYSPKQKVSLTEEQMEYVRNNFSTMSAVEMARILFSNPKLSNLNQESRSVEEYVSTLNPGISYQSQFTLQTPGTYEPPKTMNKIISKVNNYIYDGINKDKIGAKQRKDLTSLIGYLHTFRFLHHINNFSSPVDKELFESSFIRYTYDKGDLSQEEVDQFIVLSIEVVIASNIQRRVERLQDLLDGSANDTEGRRISMSLVESIDTSQKEYNQCIIRQQKLLESLKEKRSDKLKKQIGENASILNLVQLWKEEESRKKLIKMAEKRKESLKNEIEKLSTMDEIKAKIMGISDEEIING